MRLLDSSLCLVGDAAVGRDREDISPGFLQLGDHRVEWLRASCAERNRRSSRDKSLGYDSPDAARRPGDQGPLICETSAEILLRDHRYLHLGTRACSRKSSVRCFTGYTVDCARRRADVGPYRGRSERDGLRWAARDT